MSQEVEIEDETILNLPSIEERLGALRPSRQLLEFYRRKTEELETEHDKLFNKIEGTGSLYNIILLYNIYFILLEKVQHKIL